MSTIGNQTFPRNQVGERMATMAGAALVLGLAFNSVNPLGVRMSAGAPPSENQTLSLGPGLKPGLQTGPKALYENQTLSLSLETAASAPPQNAAAAPVPVPSVPTLTWPETSKLLAAGRIVLVDARAAVYYETEHVPGAVSLPAGCRDAELSAFAAKYPRNTPLVIHCGSARCPLANQLVAVLTGQLGYTDVREMPGGFAEYRQFQAQLAKGGAQ